MHFARLLSDRGQRSRDEGGGRGERAAILSVLVVAPDLVHNYGSRLRARMVSPKGQAGSLCCATQHVAVLPKGKKQRPLCSWGGGGWARSRVEILTRVDDVWVAGPGRSS